ncbi:DUF905 family protein [Escherichia coli]|uniref:DUF905 family protein n=1 Tax=Escherichia coli TaxID=562 RepID=UPI000CE2BCBD|nr:DUF905 family protein [Escherichia coli]
MRQQQDEPGRFSICSRQAAVVLDTVTVKVANVTKYDDHQVEIREADTNLLIWRAWDFEPDFEYNFKQQLQRFIKN